MQALEFMERFNGYTIVRATEALMPDLSKLFLLTHKVKIPVTYFIRKFETNVIAEKYIGHFAYAPDGEVASFYAVFPMLLTNGEQNLLACQSGDTITSPAHQKKGLFIKLATCTYELAATLKIQVVIGFPNNQSSYGFFQRLGWSNLGRLNDYHIKVDSFNFYNYCHKFSVMAPAYRCYIILLKLLIGVNTRFDNSCSKKSTYVVLRNTDFFEYKKYNESHIIKWKGFYFWIKFDDGIYLGDVGFFNLEKESENFKKALTSLAKLLGVTNVKTSCSSGVFCDELFSKFAVQQDGLEAGFLVLSHFVESPKFGFVLGDADTF
jgi:hypothetical protein